MQVNEMKMNWKAVLAIITTTIILTVDRYRNLLDNYEKNALFFYLFLPLFIIIVIFRESPQEYGFRLGEWKAGLFLTLVGILGISLVLPTISHFPGFQEYYSPAERQIIPLTIKTSYEMIGWEFFFRGFLLFALYRIAGPHALWLQAVPFTLAHFGKPELETLSCIFGGTAFGYVAWRTNSFIYPFMIHTYLAILTVLFT